MEKFDFNEVSSNDFGYTGPQAGGYIATIISAVDNPEKKYLAIGLDIAEGDHAGYYKSLFERAGFWGLTSYRSYKPKARGFFTEPRVPRIFHSFENKSCTASSASSWVSRI